MSKFHVDQIANFLHTNYAAGHERGDLDPVNNLSRYLGLYSLDLTLGDDPSAAQRLIEVTDGSRDRGIDAIAVDPVQSLLVLSQSKFRQDGTGGVEVAESLRFVEGVRSLLGARNTGEPIHASAELRSAVRELLITPSARIQLVTVSTGNQPLSPEVLEPITALLSEMNDLEGVEPIMTHIHLGQADLFNSLTGGTRAEVDLEVDLLNWGGGTADPLKILYGKVSGADIAKWYQDHKTDLFAENIRVVIPRSEINAGMADTVKNNPERFGYYNNGIVILANNIATSPGGLLNRDVLRVGLNGSSIVNGAQTVSTLGSLLGTEWEQNLSQVFVLTRCIEVPVEDPSLARGITRYANTQNEVSSQDFSFLDEQQHRLARELSLLGYEYVIRQAEQPSADDPSKIIFLRDAAVALACADSDISLSITAKREVSRLFSQAGNEYRRLFNASTDPLMLQRAVLILRRVDSILDGISADATGVELGVSVHGRLVVAHLALQLIGAASLKNPEWELEPALVELATIVPAITASIASVFPENSYPGNVFKNKSRTDELLASAAIVVERASGSRP